MIRTESITSVATVAGIVFGLITAGIGVLSYKKTNENNFDVRTFESKKPFFEKQIDFYVDAMETVSKIATDSASVPEDTNHFWKIYWGRMGAVEDRGVDRAMVMFGQKLKQRETLKLAAGKTMEPECLHQASLLLAHCVKKSWEQTWRVSLGDAPEMPCEDSSFEAVRACQ
jgi:hypothetical protein